MNAREDFGPALRRERERRGISLQAIAETTKISAGLFAAMERNDFSRWPDGIFRRSFLRAYAEAIGLDADRTVNEYLRLFHPREDGPGAEPPTPRGPKVGGRVRALVALLFAWLIAFRDGVARRLSRRPAPPVAEPPVRHATRRRRVERAQPARRHRPRRGEGSRPRV